MNKISKYMSFAMVAMMGAGWLVSCDDSKDSFDYLSYGGADAGGVYIPAEAKTRFAVTTHETSYSFTLLYRGQANGSLTVPVTITPVADETISEAFQFASTVTFADGELTAPITLTCDASMLPISELQQFYLEIDPEYGTVYGPGDVIFSIYRDGDWTSLGTGIYRDTMLYTSLTSYETEVEFWQSDDDPNLFRIQNPYQYLSEDSDNWFEFRVLQEGETFTIRGQEEEIQYSDIVYYPMFRVDYYDEYSTDIYIEFPGDYFAFSNQANWLYNYVWEYQDNGLPGQIHLSPIINFLQYGYRNTDYITAEWIQIIFPGVEEYDAGIYLTYNGIITNSDGSKDVITYVELGEDVAYAKIALLQGSYNWLDLENEGILYGIDDGTIPTTEVRSTGEYYLPFDLSNPAGRYTLVGLSYYENSKGEIEPKFYSLLQFTNLAEPEEWNFVGTGTYYYLQEFRQGWNMQPAEKNLYQSSILDGRFMIEDWFNGGKNFIFFLEDNNKIVVEDQPTGTYYQDPTTGKNYAIYVQDTGSSRLSLGIYNFSVMYYVSDGYLAYGTETFIPSTDNNTVSTVSVTNREVRKVLTSHDSMLKKPDINNDITKKLIRKKYFTPRR